MDKAFEWKGKGGTEVNSFEDSLDETGEVAQPIRALPPPEAVTFPSVPISQPLGTPAPREPAPSSGPFHTDAST